MNSFRFGIHRPVSLTAILYYAGLLCLAFLLTPLTAVDDTPTAYEVLKDYDFPVGLLPKGVLGYDLDKTTGKFSVNLNGTCSFSLEGSYQLKYRSTINGYISQGKLTKLQGISVKVFFFWVNIVEVTRYGDELEFSVGIASASFPVDNFEECLQCGCGMDCVNAQVKSIRTNPFAISSSWGNNLS
ncbi:PREDICTED: uncharacterized protein At5g01610-like [Nelumbo nucifera]|uniref:Uncharacterized protein At5g01610-like n=2 Tax=Nelumbo nucifera TaxID=4432 RepID=A0A1U8Q413_NELNU|nr:PREDICTED: uncharacterized protein At5g01610-like [Nelumbo nucifera]DAD38112.1 TPA_asm: hypothetical protein HUJ06_008753 [Nelumbo nucifera]